MPLHFPSLKKNDKIRQQPLTATSPSQSSRSSSLRASLFGNAFSSSSKTSGTQPSSSLISLTQTLDQGQQRLSDSSTLSTKDKGLEWISSRLRRRSSTSLEQPLRAGEDSQEHHERLKQDRRRRREAWERERLHRDSVPSESSSLGHQPRPQSHTPQGQEYYRHRSGSNSSCTSSQSTVSHPVSYSKPHSSSQKASYESGSFQGSPVVESGDSFKAISAAGEKTSSSFSYSSLMLTDESPSFTPLLSSGVESYPRLPPPSPTCSNVSSVPSSAFSWSSRNSSSLRRAIRSSSTNYKSSWSSALFPSLQKKKEEQRAMETTSNQMDKRRSSVLSNLKLDTKQLEMEDERQSRPLSSTSVAFTGASPASSAASQFRRSVQLPPRQTQSTPSGRRVGGLLTPTSPSMRNYFSSVSPATSNQSSYQYEHFLGRYEYDVTWEEGHLEFVLAKDKQLQLPCIIGFSVSSFTASTPSSSSPAKQKIGKVKRAWDSSHQPTFGDALVGIGETSVAAIGFYTAIQLLHHVPKPVTLRFQKVMRRKREESSQDSANVTRMEMISEETTAPTSTVSRAEEDLRKRQARALRRRQRESEKQVKELDAEAGPYSSPYYSVLWRDGQQKLGIGFCMDEKNQATVLCLSSLASHRGVENVEVGDTLVAVNGQETKGVSFEKIISLVRDSPKPLFLTLRHRQRKKVKAVTRKLANKCVDRILLADDYRSLSSPPPSLSSSYGSSSSSRLQYLQGKKERDVLRKMKKSRESAASTTLASSGFAPSPLPPLPAAAEEEEGDSDEEFEKQPKGEAQLKGQRTSERRDSDPVRTEKIGSDVCSPLNSIGLCNSPASEEQASTTTSLSSSPFELESSIPNFPREGSQLKLDQAVQTAEVTSLKLSSALQSAKASDGRNARHRLDNLGDKSSSTISLDTNYLGTAPSKLPGENIFSETVTHKLNAELEVYKAEEAQTKESESPKPFVSLAGEEPSPLILASTETERKNSPIGSNDVGEVEILTESSDQAVLLRTLSTRDSLEYMSAREYDSSPPSSARSSFASPHLKGLSSKRRDSRNPRSASPAISQALIASTLNAQDTGLIWQLLALLGVEVDVSLVESLTTKNNNSNVSNAATVSPTGTGMTARFWGASKAFASKVAGYMGSPQGTEVGLADTDLLHSNANRSASDAA